MARYELIIEQQQPTCGGRAPTRSEVRMVETNDPVEYVRKEEPGVELEVEKDGDVVTVRGRKNGLWMKYEFTED